MLGQAFSVLAIPGHTAGHIAYVTDGLVFCGDTLFGAGCGRLFEGTPEQMARSLESLKALPDATSVYCAHEYTEANLRFALAVEPGNRQVRERVAAARELREKGLPTVPSTIALEKATNPFLRCGEQEVVAAARQRGGVASDAVSVFATLRTWRNAF